MNYANHHLFLDMRWLRGGRPRGIGYVSKTYLKEILKFSDKFSKITLITTNDSVEYLKNIIKDNHPEMVSIKTAGLVYGDLYGIKEIIKRNAEKSSIRIYLSFGNTIAFKWNEPFKQINFLHDFAWNRKRLVDIKIPSKKSLGDVYCQINHKLLANFTNKFIFVSPFVTEFADGCDIYKYRSTVILNPIPDPLVDHNIHPIEQKISNQGKIKICWVGGDSHIKNSELVYKIASRAEINQDNLHFTLIGLSSYKNYKEKNNVTLKGILNHEEMLIEIEKADIVLVTSYTESFSIPAVLAYNLKKKIVGTKNSPFKYFFKNNYFPIDPNNEVDTYDKLMTATKKKYEEVVPLKIIPEEQTLKLIDQIIDPVPIIIYHNGKQKYFISMLNNIVQNGIYPIVVCNQSDVPNVPGVKFINLFQETIYDKDVFCEIYKHMSTNGRTNEVACFIRWFEINHVAHKLGLSRFWHLDSDILLFPEFLTYKQDIEQENTTAIFTPTQKNNYQQSSTAHVSIWNIQDLDHFTNFILMTYSQNLNILENKWKYHIDSKINGGVSDMTLLYLWQKNYKEKVKNINEISKEKWNYNDNINIESPEGLRLLSISKINGLYVSNEDRLSTASMERCLPFIHCQGRAKPIIALYNAGINLRLLFKVLPAYFSLKNNTKKFLNVLYHTKAAITN